MKTFRVYCTFTVGEDKEAQVIFDVKAEDLLKASEEARRCVGDELDLSVGVIDSIELQLDGE